MIDIPEQQYWPNDPQNEGKYDELEEIVRNVWDMFADDDISTERLLTMTAIEASRQLGRTIDECDVAEVIGS